MIQIHVFLMALCPICISLSMLYRSSIDICLRILLHLNLYSNPTVLKYLTALYYLC
jgi:hypothetical protein